MGKTRYGYFSLLKYILNKKINIFNKGKLIRDFTYIDDIVDGIIKSLIKKNKDFKIYNLEIKTNKIDVFD